MAKRNGNKGLVYLRRSSGKQELSLDMQLEWANTEANKMRVAFDATPEALARARERRLVSHKSIRLDDGVSGAVMTRPGFLAAQRDVMNDPSISHLFIHKRDRFGRPEDAMEMAMVEKSIRRAGVTIVLSDEVAGPMDFGNGDPTEDIKLILVYTESGNFLRNLAERVIQAHQMLARDGFRTGGDAPYGFVRILVDVDGNEVEELSKGKCVRQPGHHVRVKPKDMKKLAIWVLILDMYHDGAGLKRIAVHLNDLGIPSPGAGRVRTDNRVPHQVSGKWTAGTVRDLIRNPAILGVQTYGRRSEGRHRRVSEDGPRKLTESDRRPDGNPRLVENDSSVVISKDTGGQPLYDRDRWEEIQRRLEARGKCQRGIPRAKDPAKYPMSCRITDLTNGCGSVMYGIVNGKRKLHVCGRYMRTEGAECHKNSVDAEAALRFTLKTIRQLVDRHGDRGRLREKLLERAQAARAEESDGNRPDAEIDHLTSCAAGLSRELETVQRRMAREDDDDLYEALRHEFRTIKTELEGVKKRLSGAAARSEKTPASTAEQEVESVISLLDDVDRITSDPQARADVNPLLVRMGVCLGLFFTEAIKGKTRKIRKLVGGVMTFGDAPLPVRPHGKDNREDDGVRKGVPSEETDEDRDDAEAHGAAGKGAPGVSVPTALGFCGREGISVSKGGRGERIRTSDLLNPIQAR